MNRLTNLTPAEKNFLMMLLPQLRGVRQKAKSAEPAYRPEQSACAGESQRYADRQRALREDERQQSSLPGHVRARRAADCAFWRFSGADTPKLPAIHSCE